VSPETVTDASGPRQPAAREKEDRDFEFVLRAARAGTWRWDPLSNVVEVSAQLRQLLGFMSGARSDSLERWLGFVHPDDRGVLSACLEAARQSGRDPIQVDLRLYDRDGVAHWFTMRAAWRERHGDEPRVLLGACLDIDELKAAQAARHQSDAVLLRERSRFARILDQMPSGVVVTDMPSGRVIFQNQLAASLLGQGAHTLGETPDFTVFHFSDPTDGRIPADELPLARTLRHQEATVTRDLVYHRRDGASLDVALTTAPVYDADGVARAAVAVLNDIAARKRAERQLANEKERAQVTLAAIADGVIATDTQGAVTSMNPAAERLTAETETTARGRALSDVLRFEEPEAGARLAAALQRCQSERRTIGDLAHATLQGPGGERHAVESAVAPIALADDTVAGAVLVLHDVTESKRLLRRLGFEASHDALTGLVNRREFEARLKRAIERARHPGGSSCALLYMDLDQFKIVNDTCGHSAGDELLRQLAAAYCTHVRERDTLARLGGDEFAMIVEHCDVTEALAVADKILDATRNFRFSRDGHLFQLGVSIGVAPVDRATRGVEEAMRRADHACYVAKERGRNRVYVHYSGDVDIAQRRSDMHWVTRLSHAFQHDQLMLYCQPIVPLGDGDQRLHYEILIRMKDGHSRPIAPGCFLPAAERYDAILKIDRWVLARTLTWLAANPDETAKLEMCSINLSRRSLADQSFHEFAADLIDRSPVPAGKLCFEITETGAIADMNKTIAFIDALAGRGCRFSLDDFGTGVTSFSYLKQLPVDFIKIDGSFIQTMCKSKVDFEMVRFTNDISHMMGRRTIAEYVSDPQIADQLKRIGVDFAQGYWVGRPRPLEV
jgi:diguanylate cyclase (GGDEF)-like protein/PAS domain S-box-containing protein